MSVTSDTLFHFTKSRSSLINILNERFKLSYCVENSQIGDMATGTQYIPMISFCDIPLAQIKDHISKYGSYAIGMTKNWAIKHKLNPVLYLEKGSEITKGLENSALVALELVKALESIHSKIGDSDVFDNLLEISKNTVNNVDNLIRYVKNYEGDLKRGTTTIPNYRFYDEREWRLVPWGDFMSGDNWHLTDDEYKAFRGSKKTKPLLNEPILSFTSDDIKYIIVKDDNDIPPMIKEIKSIPHLCSNSNSADVLITRILTIDCLNRDF